MLDHHDREKFAAIYRLLADVLEHEARAEHNDDAMSYRLGDLAGRVFMGTPAEPPDEVLEAAVQVLRSGRFRRAAATGRPPAVLRRTIGPTQPDGDHARPQPGRPVRSDRMSRLEHWLRQ